MTDGRVSGRRTDPAGSRSGATGSWNRKGRLALVTLLATFGLGSVGWGLAVPDDPLRATPTVGDTTGPLPPEGPNQHSLARSEPVRLHIPSVDIHTDLVELGLNADETLEVPQEPMLAGWYTGSPTPGEIGPSIVVGHVASRETGPAVFFPLAEIAVGARIRVNRADGSVAAFEVVAVRAYAKSHFPTETVYGNTEQSTLRVITCGNWNAETNKYEGNVVVFARLLNRAGD